MNKTRKNILWKGWKNERPSYAERTKMLKSCGKKCFLEERISRFLYVKKIVVK